MEPRADDWDVVIKVKYGDTLKRFNAYVYGLAMDHNMNKLRSKIINLFKLGPDVDLVLTYTDGDGDVVTLEDDEELHDAVIVQRLNPLRINVLLKFNNTCGESYLKPEVESSTPASFRHIEDQLTQISSTVDEALKSVPEPLSSALSKLSHDFMVKAASSAPTLAEFVDYFSKLAISNPNQTCSGPIGGSLGSSSGVTTQPGGLEVSAEPKALNTSAPMPPLAPIMSSVTPVREHLEKQHEIDNSSWVGKGNAHSSVNYDMDTPDVSMNLDASGYPSVDDILKSIWTPNDNLNHEKESGADCHEGKSVLPSSSVPVPPVKGGEQCSRNYGTSKPALSTTSTFGMPDIMSGDYGEHFPISGGPCSSGPYSMLTGMATKPTLVPLPRPPFYPIVHPYRKADGYQENMLRTFHRGVRCDGCGMHPIVGPRFKSNVNEDYDLCGICFAEMGNEVEYTRIDRTHPLSHRTFKEFHNSHSRRRHPSAHAIPTCWMRPPRAKLESRFIQDVTVLDGTMMPPSTPFTKIWRMRNNGTTRWPYGTELVWVGGDHFASRRSVQLEIPAGGCPVDMEIDVAVDFTSPSTPGRYVSYWRLAAPSGQKFGQRVWVLIQVDNSRANSTGGRVPADINLNLPPESGSSRNGVRIIDVNAEPVDGACPEPIHANFTDELVKPLIDETLSASVEPAATDGTLQPLSEITPSVDANVDFPPALFTGSPVTDLPQSEMKSSEDTVEQTMLKELEEMGFKQIDLNKEVLRQHEYDLAQAVDDLCGFAEWDPLLAELREMGFHDKEMNKKLLIKNGGSIKRVVLDLIAGEKAE